MNNYIDKLNCLIDLHLHLDGAISVDNAIDLANRQNMYSDLTYEDFYSKLCFSNIHSNLKDFLSKFDFSCSLLKSKIGIKYAIINLSKELKNNGLMYAEVRFAPSILTSDNLNQEDIVISAIEALNETAIPINLILCCMRRDNFLKENIETIKLAKKYLNKGIVAIDLAGLESKYPVDNFKELFELADKLEVAYVIHAGEDDGPNSVKNAIKYNLKRIGHGVRTYEDKDLMKYLAKNKYVIELCPTSNVLTGIFNNVDKVPIKEFLDNDLIITINTDDPGIEGIDLKHEFRILDEIFNIDSNTIKKLIINSAKYSFASEQLKKEFYKKIEDNFNE